MVIFVIYISAFCFYEKSIKVSSFWLNVEINY